jgi:hypothetical protein
VNFPRFEAQTEIDVNAGPCQLISIKNNTFQYERRTHLITLLCLDHHGHPNHDLEFCALHNGNIDAPTTVSPANTAGIRASQRAMPDTREQFDRSSTVDIQQCIKYQEKPLTDLVAPMQSLIRNMLSNTSRAYKGTRAPPELELVAGRR